ncbi:PD-(D/E)XK nuclease family protein [bacterium]|nr:PD-(D/E)XK nuclease family protein [bacterium]
MPDPFVEQLKELCREHPVQAKWVLVPTHSLRWTLGERLLQEGCNWVNLRLVTPLQMALEAAAPDLLDGGINPCPETLGPSLLQNLLLQKNLRPGYFLPLILQPGMADALWRTLQEFRLAGLRARDLQPNTLKNREIRELFQAYEDYLETEKLADRAVLLETRPSLESISPQDLVLVYPYHSWSPEERNWLARLPGQRRAGHCALQAPSACPGWLPRQVVPVSPPQPSFFWATRRSDEVDEIAWRLRQSGTPLDQVEIAASQEDYSLIRDRMAAVGFPCTFDSGLPMVHCRPGQALDGLLTWLEQGLSAYHLHELLRADLLRAQPNSFVATRLLEAAQISWGRETYHPQLQALAEISQRRAARDPEAEGLEQELADIESLRSWLRSLFQRLPPPDAGDEIQPQQWLVGLQETLKSDFRARDAAEEGARQGLVRALEELKMLPGEHWPVARFLPLVRQRLQSLRALASRPRAGHLHVTRPESMGLSGRPVVFWIGLEEGRLLKTPPEDCVFSDEDRALLHPDLKHSSQPPAEKLFHLRERRMTLSGSLTMSFAQRDMAGDQEQLPAWLYLEEVRGQYPEVDSYEKLGLWLGPPAQPPSPPINAQDYPHLARGAQAESMRASSDFTVYDGLVPSAAGLWDPRTGGQPISVSRLKNLATCPFQVFLELGLRLRRSPLQLPEPDSWLDAATRGTVLHEVYAAYHRALKSRGWRPDAARDRNHLQALLDQQLERVRAILPPPSAALEKAERHSLKRDLLHFLHLEVQATDRRPMGFEVPFGLGEDPLEPMAHPDPVVLDMGDGTWLPVRGRIDRIDQMGEDYAVVDYKTGKRLYTGSRNAVFDRGRHLQHALYALVVEQMLNAPGRVRRTSYYFPTTLAARPWNHYDYPDRRRFFGVVSEVLEPLATGTFAHTHETAKDCGFCDYRAACEAHRDENQKAKLDNLANTTLQSRRRLLEEE